MAGRARSTDPGTSHSAAAHVNTADLEAKFIAALRRIGHPLTTTEIAVVCGYPRDSFSPRAIPLLEKRLIVKAAKRLCQNGKGNWRMMLAYGLPGWSRELLLGEGDTRPKPSKRAKAKAPVEPVPEPVAAPKPSAQRRGFNDPRQGALL